MIAQIIVALCFRLEIIFIRQLFEKKSKKKAKAKQ